MFMDSWVTINIEYDIITLVEALKILIITIIMAWNLRVKLFSPVLGLKYLIFWIFISFWMCISVHNILYILTAMMIIHEITSFSRECLKCLVIIYYKISVVY